MSVLQHHFRAFGTDATNADSFQPFLDLTLKTVLDNQQALAGALSDEPNVCALLALSADNVASKTLECIVHSPRPPALPPPNCILA
jgi:hypothetical protein